MGHIILRREPQPGLDLACGKKDVSRMSVKLEKEMAWKRKMRFEITGVDAPYGDLFPFIRK